MKRKLLEFIKKRPTRRRTNKTNKVDLEFMEPGRSTSFVLANYVDEDLADEILAALEYYYSNHPAYNKALHMTPNLGVPETILFAEKIPF